MHRALILNVWNRAFSLGGDWNDEKVSLGVVVAVLVTYVPLANARACHSYTDCYLRRARVPFSLIRDLKNVHLNFRIENYHINVLLCLTMESASSDTNILLF